MSLIQKTPVLLTELPESTLSPPKTPTLLTWKKENTYHPDGTVKSWGRDHWKAKYHFNDGKRWRHRDADSCPDWDCDINGQYCPPGRYGSTGWGGTGYCCVNNTWKKRKCTVDESLNARGKAATKADRCRGYWCTEAQLGQYCPPDRWGSAHDGYVCAPPRVENRYKLQIWKRVDQCIFNVMDEDCPGDLNLHVWEIKNRKQVLRVGYTAKECCGRGHWWD